MKLKATCVTAEVLEGKIRSAVEPIRDDITVISQTMTKAIEDITQINFNSRLHAEAEKLAYKIVKERDDST